MDTHTFSKSKEYITSEKEMNRRKKAFTTLEMSLFISVFIFSLDIIISLPQISIPFLIIFAIILILFRAVFSKSFDKKSYLRVCLSESELELKFKNSSEKYLLVNIENIRIKRTVKGFIREVRIGISGMNNLFINGLEDFEKFTDDLLSMIKNVQVENYREPIDFDHPLYYVFFGTTVGIVSTLLFRLIAFIGENTLKYIQLFIALLNIIMGIFWILNKPVKGRYGNKYIATDRICGLLLLIIGCIIIIYSQIFM